MPDVFLMMRSLFEYAKTEVGSATKIDQTVLNVSADPSIAVANIQKLRNFLGLFVPSRIYVDAGIVLGFAIAAVILVYFIFGSCRQLGCAIIKLAVCCYCLVLLVFWIITTCRISDSEFHNTYVDTFEWAIAAIARPVVGSK